jgi:hypothetical protein
MRVYKDAIAYGVTAVNVALQRVFVLGINFVPKHG